MDKSTPDVILVPPLPLAPPHRHRRRHTLHDLRHPIIEPDPLGVHTVHDMTETVSNVVHHGGPASVFQAVGQKAIELTKKAVPHLDLEKAKHAGVPPSPGVTTNPDDWAADSLGLSGQHAYRNKKPTMLEAMGWPG